MGTRGAWGFRFKDKDKLTYNHWDSYPDGLGVDVITAIKDHNDERLAGTAMRLIVIDGETPPTEKEQHRYASVADLNVSDQSLTDWYCLLRHGQGDVDAYVNGAYNHMYSGNDFVYDSLWCEWAYIINMDTRQLEVYKGFNTDGNAPGRYAAVLSDKPFERDHEYHGVALLIELPLDTIRQEESASLLEKINLAYKALHPEDFDD